MIIKGNQRGSGQKLARHLMNARENDHVELHDMRGFASNNLAGAFMEVQAAASTTRCEQPFFHVILNPPPGYNPTVEQFERAIELIEDKFPALKGQARTINFHEKEGRRHCHVVWSRINENNRAVQLSHTKEKLKDVSRAMYAVMGIEAPAGVKDRSKADPLNYDIGIWQQAKRLGEDPRDLKQIIQDAWARSDDRASFERALEQEGLFLARGDRRGYVIVNFQGEAMSLTRYANLGTRELKARLGPPEHLPTLHQTRRLLIDRFPPTMAAAARVMRDRHIEELRPLSREHRAMKAAHGEQRQALHKKHADREKQESGTRAARLRKGIMGWWDRVSGKSGRIAEQNAREMQAGQIRDRAEQQQLIEAQLQERGELQGRIVNMRERHRRDRQQHRATLGLVLAAHRDEFRAELFETLHHIEDSKKPMTPEQRRQQRRDRAEKRGTMPRIADSDRMRSRRDRLSRNGEQPAPSQDGGRIDAKADFSAVDGRDAGTGETTPENEQAPTAPPDAPEPSRFPTGSGAPNTAWSTKEDRAAAIEAERLAREARERQERERGNDNDPGREMT